MTSWASPPSPASKPSKPKEANFISTLWIKMGQALRACPFSFDIPELVLQLSVQALVLYHIKGVKRDHELLVGGDHQDLDLRIIS